MLAEHALDDQGEAKGQQQAVKRVETIDMAQQRALDGDPDDADGERRQQQGRPIAEAQPVQQEPGAKGAQHVLGAMRKVDDVQKAEDDREAEAQHGIEGAVDQPDQQLRKQCRGRRNGEMKPVRHCRSASATISGAGLSL